MAGVLDESGMLGVPVVRLQDQAAQIGRGEAATHHLQEIDVVRLEARGRAERAAAGLLEGGGCVPAHHHDVEVSRALAILPDPPPPDDAALRPTNLAADSAAGDGHKVHDDVVINPR